MFITNKKTFHPGSTTSPNGMVVTTPTEQEFIAAFLTTHYAPPTDVQYNEWACESDQPREFHQQEGSAIFLAQLLHESGGLTMKAEEKCLKDSCRKEYRRKRDPADKFCYGRGYLQLTWSYNYKGASKALFGIPMYSLKIQNG